MQYTKRGYTFIRLLSLTIFLALFMSCNSTRLFAETSDILDTQAVRRELEFGNMIWRIKASDELVAPGPNFFSSSPESVWVDERGLHLSIQKIEDKWYSTEVFTRQRVGYGTYTFSVESDVLSYDPSVVAGFFTWDSEPEEFNREIDIEFSAWGQPSGSLFQYVVQPYIDLSRIKVFDPKLTGSSTTHRIIWSPEQIEFFSYHGPVDPDSPQAKDHLMQHWVFSGTPPSPGRVRFRINLWLFRGKAPKERADLIVTKFIFDPLDR